MNSTKMLSMVFLIFILLQLCYAPVNGQNLQLLIKRRQIPFFGGQPLPSPCPNIFQYQYGSNGWFGQISISPLAGKDSSGRLIPVTLDVQLILPASLPTKYVGQLQLAETNDMVWQKIRNGNPNNPIIYHLFFPLTSPLPSLSKISVNNNLLCSGTAEQIPGRVMTTINLNHIFYPYAIPLNVGGSQTNTAIQPQIEVPNVIRPAETPVNANPDNSPFGTQVIPTVSTSTSSPVVYIQQSTPPNINLNNQPSFTTTPSQGSQGNCGKPLSSNFLVVNGDPVTRRGEWPWMVALFHNLNDGVGIKFNCGGTLISSYYVLTAAHCSEYRGKPLEPEKIILYLGKFNLNKWSESGSQTREVRNVYVNPEYNSSADADLAILELSVRAEYGPYVQPACVWPSYQSDLSVLVGRLGTVVGWGLDENNRVSSSVPKQVQMPIVSQEDCLRSEPSYTYLTSTRTFCAGYRNGSGPCNGDSGGGFMLSMPDNERGGMKWFIRGVVSTSLKSTGVVMCDVKNYVIFTDIAKHGSWISQFTGV